MAFSKIGLIDFRSFATRANDTTSERGQDQPTLNRGAGPPQSATRHKRPLFQPCRQGGLYARLRSSNIRTSSSPPCVGSRACCPDAHFAPLAQRELRMTATTCRVLTHCSCFVLNPKWTTISPSKCHPADLHRRLQRGLLRPSRAAARSRRAPCLLGLELRRCIGGGSFRRDPDLPPRRRDLGNEIRPSAFAARL